MLPVNRVNMASILHNYNRDVVVAYSKEIPTYGIVVNDSIANVNG